MKEIEQAAQMSIGRTCGLAGFAIAVAVVGLSFEPTLAVKAGAVLTFGLTISLLVCASLAHHTPYQRTAVWLLIDRSSRPPARHAQRIINEARRTAMLWFASWAALTSALFAGVGLALAIIRAL